MTDRSKVIAMITATEGKAQELELAVDIRFSPTADRLTPSGAALAAFAMGIVDVMMVRTQGLDKDKLTADLIAEMVRCIQVSELVDRIEVPFHEH